MEKTKIEVGSHAQYKSNTLLRRITRIALILLLQVLFSSIRLYALDSIPETGWSGYTTVLTAGTEGSWDDRVIFLVNVVKVDSIYYLFYVGGDDNCSCKPLPGGGDVGCNDQLGLATSTDGIHFTKSPRNPVLSIEDLGINNSSWEEGIELSSVVYNGSEFILFVCADEGPGSGCDIGVDSFVRSASSFDGINWTVHGLVEGTYNTVGHENYVNYANYFEGNYYVLTAKGEGFSGNRISRGDIKTLLSPLGSIENIDEKWAMPGMFIHNDNLTITYYYLENINFGAHTMEAKFCTSSLNNPTNTWDERTVEDNLFVNEFRIIKDIETGKWFWYEADGDYTSDALIRVRTANIEGVPHPPATNKSLPSSSAGFNP